MLGMVMKQKAIQAYQLGSFSRKPYPHESTCLLRVLALDDAVSTHCQSTSTNSQVQFHAVQVGESSSAVNIEVEVLLKVHSKVNLRTIKWCANKNTLEIKADTALETWRTSSWNERVFKESCTVFPTMNIVLMMVGSDVVSAFLTKLIHNLITDILCKGHQD